LGILFDGLRRDEHPSPYRHDRHLPRVQDRRAGEYGEEAQGLGADVYGSWGTIAGMIAIPPAETCSRSAPIVTSAVPSRTRKISSAL